MSTKTKPKPYQTAPPPIDAASRDIRRRIATHFLAAMIDSYPPYFYPNPSPHLAIIQARHQFIRMALDLADELIDTEAITR